jgi:integral membrane protein
MIKLFTTNIGRLRLIGLLEGISLLVLLCIAVPLKYKYDDPSFVKTIGPVHGALFLLFVINSVSVAIQQKWKMSAAGKVLISCIIPLGTFFVDHFILKPAYEADLKHSEKE